MELRDAEMCAQALNIGNQMWCGIIVERADGF
jgi:hypothetical protein